MNYNEHVGAEKDPTDIAISAKNLVAWYNDLAKELNKLRADLTGADINGTYDSPNDPERQFNLGKIFGFGMVMDSFHARIVAQVAQAQGVDGVKRVEQLEQNV